MLQKIIGVIAILIVAIFMAIVNSDQEQDIKTECARLKTHSTNPRSERMLDVPKSERKISFGTAETRSITSVDQQMEKKYN